MLTTQTPVESASVPGLTSRERFLRACRCQSVDRAPVWLMRQAGRVLPEYRTLKEQHTFVEMIHTPDLAAEVTLQPIRRFGFDAAILFSDILVVPEGMGQAFRFREKGGVEMDFGIQSHADIARLDERAVVERLQDVAAAIKLIKKELRGQTALIGFAGSPWTLANFMMEGGSAKEYPKARQLFYNDRSAFNALAEKLTRAVICFLQMQIDAGVDAIQIFDSLGGLLGASAFEEASGFWMKQIIDALRGQVPVIVFAKGAHGSLEALIRLEAQVLGMDWTVSLPALRRVLPAKVGIQGNLDPTLLETSPAVVAAETDRIVQQLRGRPGHIFNLGHGVPPGAKLECLEALVRTIRSSP
ncbi:MAG: uroporphyrinogen decarboxylase [Verrucomicrobiota bacterium]